MIGNGTCECHAYLSHMDHEHRQFNQHLAEIRKLFLQGDTNQSVNATLAIRLKQFNDELTKHFREEEDGGCLEEAACRCPSLTHEVSVIERQHRELKSQLAAIIAAVEQAYSAASNDFEKFTQALEEHENLETQVLQRGFNTANTV